MSKLSSDKFRNSMISKDKKKLILMSLCTVICAAAIIMLTGFRSSKALSVQIDHKKANKPIEKKTIEVPLNSSVGELCNNGTINVNLEYYTPDTDINNNVKDVDCVTFRKKVNGVIQVDGKKINYLTAAETVGDVLKENNVCLGALDFSKPAKDVRLTEDINAIAVVRVITATASREQDVDFKTEYIDNPEKTTEEESIITRGVKGKKVVVEKLFFYDGKEKKREKISSATLVAPVTQVVERGTRTPNGGHAVGGYRTAAISDFDFICAVVAQEGGYSYDGALAVISCMMNRADSGAWGGSDIMSVITAPGQFSAYLDGDYQARLGTTAGTDVERAVTDCMQKGIRNHNYQSFRGYAVEGGTQIGGNYFF